MSKIKHNPSTKAFKLITDKATINAGIKDAGVRSKSLKNDIHVLAVSCLNHADLHGDITLANKLISAIGGVRAKVLQQWFCKFGKFKMNKDRTALEFAKGKETALNDAIGTPFYSFEDKISSNAVASAFDINAAILSLVKRAEGAAKKGQEVDTTRLTALKALVA